MELLINLIILGLISTMTGIFIYFLYIITVLKKEKKLEKFLNNGQVQAIVKRYKIDMEQLDKKKAAKLIMKSNSFVIAISCFIAMFFENFILSIGIGFVCMLIFLFVEYKYLGKKLKKEVI